ncbi:MAG TPA: peptidoglycan-associated lipoprotein Pal [Terriglobales bacterium]|nr:peptidoglycan-associated lipoprotein Pal [Terriglobales bacterium]
MKITRSQWTRVAVALAICLTVGACKKKTAPAPPPPPPPPAPAPTASLTANPNSIAAGQSTTLIWRTDYATDVSIDSIGKVDPSGSRTVTPTESTTYHLVARNDTGTQEATARVTVTQAAAPPPPPSNETEAQMFAQNVQDVFFDYDSYDVTQQYQQVLQADARFLQQHPNIRFTIEGHCDERGSTEYNLALGDNRANSTKQALVSLGIPADRMRTISYGKEKPFCTESTEACWAQNRRAHFVYQR